MITAISGSSINKVFYQVIERSLRQGEDAWPREKRRGGRDTVDSPGPAVLEITNPLHRILTIPARLNSLPATAAETIWVLAGRDDMEFLSFYLKRAPDFSDDGKVWRAAYGPRLRRWSTTEDLEPTEDLYDPPHDQLAAVIAELRERPESRRAVIGLLNPARDHENFTAKDFPCTQTLHFIPRSGHLDLDIHIRSNDILWGLTGVNIFEFTVMQELVAHMVALPVGRYYHIADSLHYYTDYQKRMENMLNAHHFDIYDRINSYPSAELPVCIAQDFGLSVMDDLLKEFLVVEQELRQPLGNFKKAMEDAYNIIRWMPLPLPDICRCMLIYLATKMQDQTGERYRMQCCNEIISVLQQIRDPATKVGMIEWLIRQKELGDSAFKAAIMKEVPDYIKPHIGNFIREEML